MSAVAASTSVSVGVGEDSSTNEPVHMIPWRGREVTEVRHVSVGTDAQLSEHQNNENMRKMREMAIETGRWASYFFAWAIPALVYVIGVGAAALISPYTAGASIPAFIAVCAAVHAWAIPAIRERFNRLRESA